MKIILPKASKGLKFDLVFTVDMNDFDVEMLCLAFSTWFEQKGGASGSLLIRNFTKSTSAA